MGILNEEVEFPAFGVRLEIVERTKDETRDPWKIIGIEIDGFQSLTPKELREIGKWLYQQGRRIGRAYKSNGAPRAASNNKFEPTRE